MQLPFGVKIPSAFSKPVYLLNAITSQVAQIGGVAVRMKKRKVSTTEQGGAGKINRWNPIQGLLHGTGKEEADLRENDEKD